MLGVSGESIPSDDAVFDTLVCTWTLCTIPNVQQALSEMYRVVKPGGRLLFIEHGRSPDAAVAKWQRRIEPFWKKIAGGCHLTRKADDLIAESGFHIERLEFCLSTRTQDCHLHDPRNCGPLNRSRRQRWRDTTRTPSRPESCQLPNEQQAEHAYG